MQIKGWSLLAAVIAAWLVMFGRADAQTIISGPNVSGTWTSAGNPYVVTGNITVPSGESLIIQPGVVVEIGSGLSITVDGVIAALGTSGQHIVFKAPVGSLYWNNIMLFPDDVSQTNNLKFCDFQNASTALELSDPNPGTIFVNIVNCTFSNCLTQAILMDVGGNVVYTT